jgi:hypothetical protein
MGMRFINRSQHETMSYSRQLFRPSLSNPPLNASSTLKRTEGKLRDVSDRVENAGYTGSDENTKAVSVIDCQTSGKAQTRSAI